MKKMKSVVIEEVKVFKCQEEGIPVPKEDEVLIAVTATGVTKMDVLRTQSKYQSPPDWNPVPGLQCTGTIIDVGRGVHGWKSGDKVCALLNGGGYADAVVVRATQVLPLPRKDLLYLSACLPEAACTTWEALIRLCDLSANMTLLVYERCGIICDLAVQLAQRVQAKVIVARDKSTFVQRFSSHVQIDINSSNFMDAVYENSGREGVNVILDSDVSTLQLEDPYILNTDGRIVLVELGPQKLYTMNFRSLGLRNGVLHVVNRMWWPPEYLAEVVLDMRQKMWPEFESGNLELPDNTQTKFYGLPEAGHACIGDLITP